MQFYFFYFKLLRKMFSNHILLLLKFGKSNSANILTLNSNTLLQLLFFILFYILVIKNVVW